MQTTEPAPPSTNAKQQDRLRGLILAYALLALFWLASSQVATLNALWLGVYVLLLAVPVMLALWHQGSVRRLLALHQFASGAGLFRWAQRRTFAIVLRALVAIVLSAAVLLQSVFFGRLEWLLVGIAPIVLVLVQIAIETSTNRQFSHAVYARRWSMRASQVCVVLLLTGAWVAASWLTAADVGEPYAERIHGLQSQWAQSPSGLVRSALDAGAWGQAAIEALGRAGSHTGWRLVVALVVAPISIFGFAVLSTSGASLPLAEIRRTLGEKLSAEDSPPSVGAARAAQIAAISAICLMLLFQAIGAIDSRLRGDDSPFRVAARPECERIGGKVYKLNTSALLTALMNELNSSAGPQRDTACAKLSSAEKRSGQAVDAYLDWYFSLGAEWLRLASMLTGNIDQMLQTKLVEMINEDAELKQLLSGAMSGYELHSRQFGELGKRIDELLEQNRLVIDDGACKVVAEIDAHPLSMKLDQHQRARLITGSGGGLVAGAFAATLAAKAMGKTSMKLAAKVLAKAVAKKAAGKAAATGAGAAIGSIIAPGAGTAVGAAIGAGVGVAIGVAIDMAMLAAEEKLYRADMKADLLVAVEQTVAPFRETLGCEGR